MAYLGNTPTQQGFTPAIDYFSGNASTTAFTLSRPVASVAQVQAVIENVPQNPGDAFTVSGNTITFTSAPPSGTNNIYVYYTSPITTVVQPGQGTVAATQIEGNYALWNKSGSGINYTAGNVGIGTSSPGALGLTINKTSGTGAGLQLYQSGSEVYRLTTDNTAVYVQAIANIPMQFYTNNTERMRIDSSGNIYVGNDTTCNLKDFRSKSLGTNGYQKLAGGMIIQWGLDNVNINQTAVTITLPIAFPTACCSVVATISGANNVIGNGVGQVQTNSFSTTTFNIFGDYTSATATNVPTSWIAIGY